MKTTKVLGIFLQSRGIFFDSNEKGIDAMRFYELEWLEDLQMYSVIPHTKKVAVPMSNFDNTVG